MKKYHLPKDCPCRQCAAIIHENEQRTAQDLLVLFVIFLIGAAVVGFHYWVKG